MSTTHPPVEVTPNPDPREGSGSSVGNTDPTTIPGAAAELVGSAVLDEALQPDSASTPIAAETDAPSTAHEDFRGTTLVQPVETTGTTPKPRKGKWVMVGAFVAAAAVTVPALFGAIKVGAETDDSPAQEPGISQANTGTTGEQPTASASNTPKPTDIPSAGSSQGSEAPVGPPKTAEQLIENPSRIPDSILELGTFANLTEGQQEWMRQVDQMTPEEFIALPREEQIAFGQQIFENVRVLVQAVRAEQGARRIPFTPNPTTAQEVVDNRTLQWMATGWCYNRIDGNYDNEPVFDVIASMGIYALGRDIKDPETMALWEANYRTFADNYGNRVAPQNMTNWEREVTGLYRDYRGIVIQTLSPDGVTFQSISSKEELPGVPDASDPTKPTSVPTESYNYTITVPIPESAFVSGDQLPLDTPLD